MLNLFLNSDSTHEEIQRAGESFLLKLYGVSKCASLDELRYICNKKTFFILPVNMISCGCKADGCGVSCGCKKTGVQIGVHCSTLRANSSGQTFNNVGPAPLLNEDDNDERSNTDDEDDD